MKAIKYISSILIPLSFLSLIGCTKISTDFEFRNKDPKLVLQAQIFPDSTSLVYLTRSLDMFDKRQVNLITGAKINLYQNDELVQNLIEDSSGWYSIAAEQLLAGKSYRIVADKEGYPSASSDFTIPNTPEILRVDTSSFENFQTDPYAYYYTQYKGRCTIHFKDDPATENYYLVWMKRPNMDYYYNNEGELIDSTFTMVKTYISSKSPYAELAYSGDSYDWKFYGDDWVTDKLLFSDRLFNGSKDAIIEVNFDQYGYFYYSEISNSYVQLYFCSVDKQFYQYARAKAEMYDAEGNPLSEPVTPYSSVENGYGLVYGLNIQTIIVDISGLFERNYNDYYY